MTSLSLLIRLDAMVEHFVLVTAQGTGHLPEVSGFLKEAHAYFTRL